MSRGTVEVFIPDASEGIKWDAAPVAASEGIRWDAAPIVSEGITWDRPFKNVGAIAARAVNLGVASFSESLDDIATAISEKTGFPKGKAFAAAKNEYLKNAEFWDAKVKDAALPEEILGEFLGGAAPGMADFMLGVPFAAVKGYAKDGTPGAVKEGAHRALMGQILHAANILTTPARTAAMAVVGGADAAAQGGDAREIAKSAGVMAGFGLVGGKGEVTAKEALSNIKWDKGANPMDLAHAVGKPEQIAHLNKMGVTEREAQAREIIRDAVEQPFNLAQMAAAKGKTDLAAQLHQKAVDNGNKLKAADGLTTEKTVDSILGRGVKWDEPTDTATNASSGKYSESPTIIEMPEIVGMAKDLLGGKYPGLVQKFRKDGVRGMFRPGSGEIVLRADLAQDMNQAAKTLSHEIGHAVDWLPDKTMARGNILGRIASLKNYAKNQVAFRPVNLEGTTQGPLTTFERSQLEKEARVLANKDAETLIDEVIKKEVPVSPDDVLAILKGIELEKDPNKDLVHFIFTADTATKKSIALQAMKGLSPKEVAHLTDTVEVKTGNKVAQSGKATRADVQAKYRDLVKNEIARRMLFDREKITGELKKHTEEWRPFTPYANNKYTAYRYSSPELYADAVSALITNPRTLQRNAPTFYKAFFNYLESKPEVKTVWEGIQDTIKSGNVNDARIAGDYEMFQRGHDAREAARIAKEKAPESVGDMLARGLWDKNHAVLKEIRSLEKQGGAKGEHARETRYNIEEISYISSEADAYMNDFNRMVQKPLETSGLNINDLGVYSMRQHIMTNREEIFSTKGYTPETSRRDLAALLEKWGPENYGQIKQAAEDYRKIREDSVIPVIEQSGMVTPELIQVMKDRKNFSRVSVIKYLEGQFGKSATSKIYKQIGTLEEIENPIVATVLQDMSMLRAARINIAKRSLIKDLQETNMITPAEMKYSQDRKGLVPVEPKDGSMAVYTVMVDGKPQHFYTAKNIVESFQYQPFQAMKAAEFWQYSSQPIRDIMVSKNPVWMARNLVRDFRSTIKNNPDVKLRHTFRLAAEYKNAWREAWQEAANKTRSETIQQMMRDRSITPDRVWQPKEMNFEDELQRIADSFNLSASADKASTSKAVRLYRFVDEIGRSTELVAKIAGKRYLEKHTDKSQTEINHLVRTRIGTPDFKRRGDWQQFTNNFFMFSNMGKEGIRTSVESYRENPASYVWKTINMNILPKAILAAGLYGVFGSYIQKITNGIPEYDLSNYTIIPLYVDDNGKSVYLRMPEDYEGQFFGALAWKLAHVELMGKGGAVSTIVEHSPYSPHPLLSAAKDLGDYYLKGQNPVDSFRGQQVLQDREFLAGGADAHWAMAKHTWRTLGGSTIYDPPRDELERRESAFEKITRTFPGSILGTFVKTSDRGISEKIEKDLTEYRKTNARISLDTDKAMVHLANGDQINKEELALILSQKSNIANKKMQGLMLKQYGTAFAGAIARARSKEEVLVILNAMEKQNGR